MTEPSLSLLVLRSSRLDAVRRFYEALGLRLQEERRGSGPVLYSCSLGETILQFHPADGLQEEARVRLGFVVRDLEGALTGIRRLRGDILKSSATAAVVCDPDGRQVDLTQGESGAV